MLRLLQAFILLLPLTLAAHAEELQIRDLVTGTGEEAVPGATVTVHYTGWLMDGTKFDSSLDRGEPFSFPLGASRVIRGWDQGVEGMRVGGKRELIIPPELGYGARGAGGVIPPNSTLRFEVELLRVSKANFGTLDNSQLKERLASGAVLVDIRRPDEWKETGVIDGARLITFFDREGKVNPGFMDELAAVAGKEDRIVFVCRSGNRSEVLARFLSERAGYTAIDSVGQGMVGWITAGNPVTDAKMPEICWLC
ncbi:FKBP-type peptidyl-prolyl cis-trans isomerase [Stappia sp. 28M-7]|uniref:FKBP-type peptidyl-prolyl cis-trans isomerase n=1 Tax=Stappia sp. 28M-7 TaxID=2762596 RepID=UPI00163B9BC7|nr:FKBP-type peptidyl-prolyl cis-trans isomerase [Stappia sp. 28M-7]MBC2860987.1 FKBP-type peptidyl-prolyl cis-trans isomerase [Stappia sp. 28M-7]